MSRPLAPCGTPTALRRHVRRGESCVRCEEAGRAAQVCADPSDRTYRRHLARWEWPCGPCMDAHAAYERVRVAFAPAAPRVLVACGSASAYRRHKRRGEEPCEACRRAHCLSVQGYQRREKVS